MVAFPKGYGSGEQVAKPAQAILTGFALIYYSTSQPTELEML